MTERLEDLIFGFLQAIAFGEPPPDCDPDFMAVFDRLSGLDSLDVAFVMQWNVAERRAMRELLSSLLLAIRVAEPIEGHRYHSEDMLFGSTSRRLGQLILDDIVENYDLLVMMSQHRWNAVRNLQPKPVRDPKRSFALR